MADAHGLTPATARVDAAHHWQRGPDVHVVDWVVVMVEVVHLEVVGDGDRGGLGAHAVASRSG